MRTLCKTMTSSTAHSMLVAGLFVAGLVHLVLTPEHVRASSILGIGFGGIAVSQLSLAGLFLYRRMARWEPVALIVVVVSLSMYMISRTIGLSFGHTHAAQSRFPELICKGAEVLVAGILTIRILRRPAALQEPGVIRPARFHAFHPLTLVVLGVMTALGLVFVGDQLASPQTHLHTAHDHPPTTLSAHDFQEPFDDRGLTAP